MKTLLFLLSVSLSLASISFAAEPSQPEEHLVEVQGTPAIDGTWFEFPPLNGRPIRVSFGWLPSPVKAQVLNATTISLTLWQIRSGDVSDPNQDGWFCEPVTLIVAGRIIFDGKICGLHHIKMERVTKWAAHTDLWDYGESMYEMSLKSFPHGLPFMMLGQFYPNWKNVRSYQCEKCVAAREQWERRYKTIKKVPAYQKQSEPTNPKG